MTLALPAARVAALAALLAGCTASRPPPRPPAPPARPAPVAPTPDRPAPDRPAPPAAADVHVGRWIAVDVVGDAEATRDLSTGRLDKVLVVNAGGHVILRGVDRRQSADPVAFTGTLTGRVLTFADLPGAAILSREGTRLVLTDPTGRQTRFIRDADGATGAD